MGALCGYSMRCRQQLDLRGRQSGDGKTVGDALARLVQVFCRRPSIME